MCYSKDLQQIPQRESFLGENFVSTPAPIAQPAACQNSNHLLPPNSKCLYYRATDGKPTEIRGPAIFLAGSIERDVEVNWQTALVRELSSRPITIFNPVREDWDDTWKEDISDPKFKEQVDWEMDQMNRADFIALYFGESKSPISLLELGMHAASASVMGKKVTVCCKDSFWKRGNVQMVCERYKLKLVDTREEFIEELRMKIDAVIGSSTEPSLSSN